MHLKRKIKILPFKIKGKTNRRKANLIKNLILKRPLSNKMEIKLTKIKRFNKTKNKQKKILKN